MKTLSPPLSSLSPVQKPGKILVPLAQGLSWDTEPEFIYQEKMDGRFETRQVRGEIRPLGETVLAGEAMADGTFYAFDLLTLHGEDFRNYPLSERLEWLTEVFSCAPIDRAGKRIQSILCSTNGAHLLQYVLKRGGEGVVRKRLDRPWGTVMEACKRLETFYCLVTGIGPGQSVQISLLQKQTEITEAAAPTPNAGTTSPSPGGEGRDEGEPHRINAATSVPSVISCSTPCGRVALRGGKCDRIRLGSIIKVEGFGLTPAGQIREPRPCKDTPNSWLVRF